MFFSPEVPSRWLPPPPSPMRGGTGFGDGPSAAAAELSARM